MNFLFRRLLKYLLIHMRLIEIHQTILNVSSDLLYSGIRQIVCK